MVVVDANNLADELSQALRWKRDLDRGTKADGLS